MQLSIIIPHYNLPAKLLKRCIDSILSIGLPQESYEIIIIDDGSQEPPRWTNRAYPQSNIRMEEHTHGGLGAARNHGIEAAQGTYILFVDADDTLQNNGTLQQCIERLKQERPDILRFEQKACPDNRYTPHCKKQKARFGNTISGAVYMSTNNLRGSACSYFIKKEFLDKRGILFTTDIYHEDEEFSTIAHYHAQTLIDSNAHLYNYHTRENSITQNRSKASIEKRLGDSLKIIIKLATFRASTQEQSNSIQKKAIARKLATLTADFVVNSLRSGKKAKEIRNTCIGNLAPLALYPIKGGNYGIKFKIFRTLANSTIGLHLLRLLVPTQFKPNDK